MHHPPPTTHHPPLTTHHAPLTAHHPPRTTHHSPLTTHHSPLTAHHPPLTTHHSPPTRLSSTPSVEATASTPPTASSRRWARPTRRPRWRPRRSLPPPSEPRGRRRRRWGSSGDCAEIATRDSATRLTRRRPTIADQPACPRWSGCLTPMRAASLRARRRPAWCEPGPG